MRDRVESVSLYDVTMDILDIEELTKYDGQGRCSGLQVWNDTRTRDRDSLRGWAADKGWTVTRDNELWGLDMDNDGWLVMERKSVSPSQSPASVSQGNCTVM